MLKIYIKCNIWRVAVRPSYIQDARFLKVKVVNVSLKCYTLPSLCLLVSYFHCTSFEYCCFPLYSAVSTSLPQRRYLRRTSKTNCRTCKQLHGNFVLNHSRFISCQKNSKSENLYRMSSWNETRSLKLQIRSRNSVLTVFIMNFLMLKLVSEMTSSSLRHSLHKTIIDSCLTFLLRNLQHCDPNDFFKFGKLMWIFSYTYCLQNFPQKIVTGFQTRRTSRSRRMTDQAVTRIAT